MEKSAKPISVCHITSGDIWAGSEVMIYNLLSLLVTYEGLQLSVILLNEGKLTRKIRDLGIDMFVVNESSCTLPKLIWRVRKIMRDYPADIIHSHGYQSGILAFLSSRFTNNPKHIRTIHNSMIKRKGQKWSIKDYIINFIDIVLLKCFYKIIVTVSYEIQKSFTKKNNIRKKKVITIHNGVDVAGKIEISNNDDKIKISNKFNIGSAGRIVPIKNYSFMIEIAARMKAIKGIFFLLAGDGKGKELLKSKVKEMQIEDIFLFKGHVEDMSDYYEKLHVYLNTSLHEGIPMSILEAMSHGLPVIAPDVGGIGEIIENGVTGFLLKEYNSENYADKILELYKNKELLDQMSQASIEKINNHFSIFVTAEKYYKIYVSI